MSIWHTSNKYFDNNVYWQLFTCFPSSLLMATKIINKLFFLVEKLTKLKNWMQQSATSWSGQVWSGPIRPSQVLSDHIMSVHSMMDNFQLPGWWIEKTATRFLTLDHLRQFITMNDHLGLLTTIWSGPVRSGPICSGQIHLIRSNKKHI